VELGILEVEVEVEVDVDVDVLVEVDVVVDVDVLVDVVLVVVLEGWLGWRVLFKYSSKDLPPQSAQVVPSNSVILGSKSRT